MRAASPRRRVLRLTDVASVLYGHPPLIGDAVIDGGPGLSWWSKGSLELGQDLFPTFKEQDFLMHFATAPGAVGASAVRRS